MKRIINQINDKVQKNLKDKAFDAEDWYQEGVTNNMKFINWLNGKDYSNVDQERY